jgi:antitoxin component of MazEF toxin-antitoxin module
MPNTIVSELALKDGSFVDLKDKGKEIIIKTKRGNKLSEMLNEIHGNRGKQAIRAIMSYQWQVPAMYSMPGHSSRARRMSPSSELLELRELWRGRSPPAFSAHTRRILLPASSRTCAMGADRQKPLMSR